MSEINAQSQAPYVGDIVELITIDPVVPGSSILRLTPSGTNITFAGQSYTPFPVLIDQRAFAADAAPSRPTMTVSANTGSVLFNMVLSYGDLVGAKVTYKKTFANFLDGQPDADPTEHFPEEKYVIIQRSALSARGITFVLATPLDQPTLMLPRRQILRDDVGGEYALWAPAVARVRRR